MEGRRRNKVLFTDILISSLWGKRSTFTDRRQIGMYGGRLWRREDRYLFWQQRNSPLVSHQQFAGLNNNVSSRGKSQRILNHILNDFYVCVCVLIIINQNIHSWMSDLDVKMQQYWKNTILFNFTICLSLNLILLLFLPT